VTLSGAIFRDSTHKWIQEHDGQPETPSTDRILLKHPGIIYPLWLGESAPSRSLIAPESVVSGVLAICDEFPQYKYMLIDISSIDTGNGVINCHIAENISIVDIADLLDIIIKDSDLSQKGGEVIYNYFKSRMAWKYHDN